MEVCINPHTGDESKVISIVCDISLTSAELFDFGVAHLMLIRLVCFGVVFFVVLFFIFCFYITLSTQSSYEVTSPGICH